MNRRIALCVAVLILASMACQALSMTSVPTNLVVGSGHITSEPRQVDGEFTSVELLGSADVNILLTNVQSVNIETDDNIAPLIETKVVNGKLIINSRPDTDYTPTHGVIVTVAIKSLERVTLSGSGSLQVAHMSGPDLVIELPGSGEITAEGTVDHLSISLLGSGTILCDRLKAHTADVTLAGSGTITLFADQSLNAKILGSGNIRYEGNPPQVKKNVAGSGSITP